ncbi:NUDIX hydrolase domain-like protein [Mycena floridula]|nr:NUDIX hydrolase domain-like protein [Mycena floridula]
MSEAPPTNMFAGSFLNRLSWLRGNATFLNTIAVSPKSRWLLFNAGQPLTTSSSTSPKALAYLATSQVKPLLGQEPYFGQGKIAGQLLDSTEENSFTESVRHHGSRVVFLGLEQAPGATISALPSSDFKDPVSAAEKIDGTFYFSMDVADLDWPNDQLEEFLKGTDIGQNLSWAEPRAFMRGIDAFNGSIFAEGRSLVDWNTRNKFCPACGSPTYSMWSGWKISCSTLLPWADNTNRKPCITGKGLHNFTHPRTDSVVITVAIDPVVDKILLGRSAKFPANFYSALAGFIEPGETLEDAVSREMWEEAGVRVTDIKYHSGQPWPYPSNVMCGFYARGDAAQPVRLDLDNELADAQWYTRAQVLEVLNHPDGTNISGRELKKLGDLEGTKGVNVDAITKNKNEPAFRVPPTTAIAGVLIRDWAEGRINFTTPVQSNL